ncbi:MAG: hypothetical protein V3S69_01690 [Dehalococcoidales bacterium]
MSDQPLGLPQGSVRAMIAMTVIGGTIALLVIGNPVPQWLQGGFFTLIGFYFGARGVASQPKPPVVPPSG